MNFDFEPDPQPDDHFKVLFLGGTIVCASLEDAMAVTTANNILTNEIPWPYPGSRLKEIADVLLRYNRGFAAGVLTQRALEADCPDESSFC